MSEKNLTWHDHYLRIVAGKRNPNEARLVSFIKAVEQGAPQSEVSIKFDDEFAPSHSRLDAAQADVWVNEFTRPFFYNGQIHEVAEAALDRAADLGLPRVLWALPHGFTTIDKLGHSKILEAYREEIPKVDEGSEDWLCMAIYYNWVAACHWATIEAPPGMIAENILVLGANCRELELAHRNKVEALERKKAKRAFAKANEGRNELNSKRARQAIAWQHHAKVILGELAPRSSNSAAANHIRKKWEHFGNEETRPIKPAKKTIENWLSKEKPSRTRLSAGK